MGELVLLDDGSCVSASDAHGRPVDVSQGAERGMLSSKKGVNLPNTKVSLPCLTEKDKRDLDFALSQDVDWWTSASCAVPATSSN